MDLNNETGIMAASIDKVRKRSIGVVPVQSILVFLFTTLSTALFLELLNSNCTYWNWQINTNEVDVIDVNKQAISSLTYAIYGKSKEEDHLIHVKNVLHHLGYSRVSVEDNWRLLWAHDYPFQTLSHLMRNLHDYQMVNHLPGCGFITNKVDLSVTELPSLPKAFRLPLQKDEFLKYVEEHPSVMFVEKHNEHRHITIKSPQDINLNSNESFVQEFIPNPFLVDGYKFDVGVYVVITNIDPLRLYIYTGDVLFRYCPVKYYPFNISNVDKYVVGDDYLPTWELPSLIKYYKNLGGNMRTSFEAYLYENNLQPSIIWTQIEDIIRQIVLIKENDIARILASYKIRNFFELMRFDFFIDSNLRVYLMEANMSPNLSSAHFKPNSLLYEQILYSFLNLIGIGSPLKQTTLQCNKSTINIKDVVTSERNLATNLNACILNDCDRNCKNPACELCLPCLTGSEYAILENSHREHLHKTNMKRIFPKAIMNPETFDIENEVQNMTKRNAWLTRWFYHKCLYDYSWCS